MSSELPEPKEQERQAKAREHPSSEDHEMRPQLQRGVDLRLGQRGDEEDGFVGPLADQVAVVCILRHGILCARSSDVVYVTRQDAALGEAIPARGGRNTIYGGNERKPFLLYSDGLPKWQYSELSQDKDREYLPYASRIGE